MDLDAQISRFRLQMLRTLPFYGDIIAHLEIQPDPTIPTACTDGLRVRYSPKFLDHLNEYEQNYVLMHEVLHILLRHCSRMRHAEDPALANIAADFIVNHTLDELIQRAKVHGSPIPLQRPLNALVLTSFRNDTFEELYAKMAADNPRRKPSGPILLRHNYSLPPDRAVFTGPKKTEPNLYRASAEVVQDLRPQSGASEGVEARISTLIRDAVKRTGPAGSGLFPIPPEIWTPVQARPLNWKVLLKGLLSEIQTEETSYSTPERKYLHMDLIIPGCGTGEEHLEEVWAFVDSSGSITRTEMDSFMTQLLRLTREYHCMMNVCFWDTRVNDVYRRIRSPKELEKCVPTGKGGTDINCVYKWLSENKVRPGVMLILTDGMFGRLLPEMNPGRMRRNTILVLSQRYPAKEDMKQIGRIAEL